jgi:hypothetical protein
MDQRVLLEDPKFRTTLENAKYQPYGRHLPAAQAGTDLGYGPEGYPYGTRSDKVEESGWAEERKVNYHEGIQQKRWHREMSERGDANGNLPQPRFDYLADHDTWYMIRVFVFWRNCRSVFSRAKVAFSWN